MLHHPITSKKRAKAYSLSLFLIGLAILSFLDSFWPAIMLVVGLPLALRQMLLGRFYDMAITLFVFVGVFVTIHFDISWRVILPVIFISAAIYVFFREYIEETETPVDEEEEDINIEIEEDQEKK